MPPDPDAPAVLSIDCRGVVTLEIMDQEGRVISYLVAPQWADEPGAWAARLTRLDGEAGPYLVSKRPGRPWHCDCPDFRYRSRRRASSCKHAARAKSLKAFIDRFTTPDTVIPMPKKKPDEQPSSTPTPDRAALPAPEEGQAPEAPQAMTVRPPLDHEQVELLKRTICPGLSDDEMQLFLLQCRRTGLDPFSRQIHAVRRSGKLVIQTGIDGYRLIADRTGRYVGNDDPLFDDEANPRKATVTVWKLVGGVRHPFTASARWAQYYPGDQQGFMWKKMPHVMLGKVAEALALRKAFPAELSGVYTADEFRDEPDDGRVAPAEAQSAPAPVPAKAPTPSFNEQLKARDAALAREGFAAAGELRKHVKGQIDLAGPDADRAAVARAAADDFEARARRPKAG